MYGIGTILLKKRSFFVLVILGLIGINTIWWIPILRNTRMSASVFALTVAERIQSEINGSLGSALNEIVGVAGEVADEPERTIITFKNLLRYHSIFTSISLVDRSGKESLRIDSSGPLPSEKFIDQSRNTSFYLALQERTTFTSPIILPNGEAHLTLVVPVPKKGEFIDKVILAELNVQNLLSIIRSPKIGRGYAYVLDRDGIEILHPNPARILKHQNLSSRPIVKKVLVNGASADGLSEDDQYRNDAGENTFTVGMPIPVVKWGVFVEQPRSQALRGQRQTIVLAIVTSLLAISIFFIIAVSINKLRKLTVQLEGANVRLKELDQMKSEFLSLASHQIRTPITVIKGYASLLLEGSLGSLTTEVREAIDRIFRSGSTLALIVDDFLNIARIEQGKLKYDFVEVDLSTLVSSVVEEQRALALGAGLALNIRVETPTPALVQADKEKVRQVISNLLDNAIKYTPHGSITVTLSGAADAESIRLSVSDTGIGIAKETMPGLFIKFGRAKNASAHNVSGTGLGLYLAKQITQAHGGKIWAESEGEGKGATFHIELRKRLTS